jgi:hypothetical protein
MTNKTDDEQWLAALQGQADGSLSKTEQEATVIRNAMMQDLDKRPAYQTSEPGFQRLMATAKTQGLLYPERAPSALQRLVNSVYAFLTMPASVMASVALLVGLSVTVSWQAEQLHGLEAETVRGGGSIEQVTQIVDSPQLTASQWQQDLLKAGISHSVAFEGPNRTLIRLSLTPAAVELLASKRIQAPAGAWCTLVIVSAPGKP